MIVYPTVKEDDWVVRVLATMMRQAMVWDRYRNPMRHGRHDRGWPKCAKVAA